MRLLALMYHRARAERHGNAPEILDAHFAHVARTYRPVLPGEELARDTLNVCLTFDDAYFDFYARVFPLLQRHRLRALLAVPTQHIGESASASFNERVNVASDDAFAQPALNGFCTWAELAEMVQSGHVAVAAHSHTHRRLDAPDADLPGEIERPHAILQARLGRSPDAFVFPFGRYSAAALRHARHHYQYLFRIGGAANSSWRQPVLYRVDADRMATPVGLFSPRRRVAYRARHYWNRLRRR